ncbi:hypothetical protein [Arthrobacter sp. StoSoilA2]|uniref:hypothetical protein n=1 Tax=Arthrobacter sp. StoSoilA2 TaxID=2830990 RepID=UPI001CC56871|nr:hypothetical protein [Arthrobacter sp. StoSoilA2]
MSPLRQSAASSSSTRVTMGAWNRALVIILGILLVSWGGPAASAFWSSVSSNFGAARADAVAQGAKPTTAVSGSSVTVTWTASTTAAGRSVTGYSIVRYASATGGTAVAAAGTCAGTVAGLSCVDTGVTTGNWYYTVTPKLSQWQGAESTRSAVTAVDATAPLAPSVTAPPYVYSGNVTAVPVSGTAEALSSVTLTVTGTGALPVTQTISVNSSGNWAATPLNLSAFSPGTINYSAQATDAAGNTGPAGVATSTKDVSSPTVTGVQLNNRSGGTLGKVEQGDSVTLTFSEPLSANTICGAWTSNTTTQAQNGNGSSQVVVNISAGDVLTVTGTACTTLRVGSISLGGDYNTNTSTALTFAGNNTSGSSLTWNPTANTLTITLGAGTSGGSTLTSTTIFPTYTPVTGLTDVAGNPLGTGPFQGAPSRF